MLWSAALFLLLLPLRAAASPPEELAARFVDVLRHDDPARMQSLVDAEVTDPDAWAELSSALERYDCIEIRRHGWSLEPAPPERLAIRVDIDGTYALKAKWRPARRMPQSWHLEARQTGGVWKLTRALTEERRVARAMLAAATTSEVERIAAEARGVDPLRVLALYGYELDVGQKSERFAHALSLARDLKDVSTEIAVQRSYATSLIEQPKRMLAEAQAAVAEAREAGSADDLADARLTLGYAEMANGDVAGALQTYAAVAAMAETLDDPTTAMKCLQTYLVIRTHDVSALATLRSTERLLTLAATYGWEEGEELGLFDHALVHFDLGNLDVVKADYRRLIALSQARGNRQFVALARSNLGSIEASESHHERAIVQFQEAIRFMTGNDEALPNTLIALAGSQIEAGRLRAAEETLREAEAISKSVDAQAALLTARSAMHFRRGNPGAAIAAAREGLQRLSTIPDGRLRFGSFLLGALARGLRATGKNDEAIDRLQEVLAAVESHQEAIDADPQTRASVAASYNGLYVDLVELLVGRNDVDEAFRVIERMRGRGLREALVASHIDLSASLSSDERSREERLEARVVEVNKALLAARQAGTPVAQLEREIEAARIDVNAFQSEVRVKHPSVARRRIDVDTALSLPPRSEALALIEYVVAPKQVIAFVVTNGSPIRAVRLPVTKETLEREVRELELLIAAHSPGYQSVARRLYAALVAPLEKQLRGKRTLTVVPDGALWNVPFPALIGRDGRHLVDRYAVFYAYSLALLRHASTLDVAVPARLLALGNPTVGGETRSQARTAFRGVPFAPLRDAEREVNLLASLYPAAQRRVLVRKAASEALFKDEAPGFNVIHVAAHALVDDRAPMYSAIVLSARSTDEDGLLEAREVADLPLNAGLAVLSACRTARGKIRSGEGVIGLNWAFFAAGCPTTVVSQWDAESKSTATLMVEFHRRLRAGDTTAAALRAAQRSLRANPLYRHPFYWAPFIAVGAANRALR